MKVALLGCWPMTEPTNALKMRNDRNGLSPALSLKMKIPPAWLRAEVYQRRKRYSTICTRCAATVVVCRSCRKRRISFSTAFRVCESVAGCLGRVQKWDKQQQRQTQGAPHATSYQCDLSLPRQQRRSSDMPQLRRQAHTDSSSWRCETSEGVSLLENRPSEIPRGRHLLPLLLQFKQTNLHRFA